MLGRSWRKIRILLFQLLVPQFRNVILYDIPKVYFKKRLVIGRKVHINDCVFINAVGNVKIGDYSVISHGVSIISTANDPTRWVDRIEDEDIHVNKKIEIGKNVWICTNAIICSGVKVADNSIVGAGSVVTKSLLEPACLYAGVPAKKIKKLPEHQ